MKITARGQLTMPQSVRVAAGLHPGTEVEFIVEADGVRIVKADRAQVPARGAMLLERLRRNRGHLTMTTDEIMALTRGED